MDKPRWLTTWILACILACIAVNVSYHDSFWWSMLKVCPFALAAIIIEHYRSKNQNGLW